MNFPLLKRLTEAHAAPGHEQSIRHIIREELGETVTYETDAMGNLICRKLPNIVIDGSRKLMIAAHMDEIGFVVKFIDDKGFLRLHPLGGFDARQLPSQRVRVHGARETLDGNLMLGVKPKHMLTAEEANRGPKLEDLFVDLGLNGEQVKEKVAIGDMVTLDRDCRMTGNFVTAKSMDNRIAVYVMIEALRAVKNHGCEILAVATVQEEIGCRGAAAAGAGLKPDLCVAIDVTLANDIPGIPDSEAITKLGEGAAIKILDSSLICHPKIVRHFRDIGDRNGIKYQMELLPFGGTDASAVQRQHGGVPSFTLSVPCRYVHTVNETIHPDDLDASVALLARYIEECQDANYALD